MRGVPALGADQLPAVGRRPRAMRRPTAPPRPRRPRRPRPAPAAPAAAPASASAAAAHPMTPQDLDPNITLGPEMILPGGAAWARGGLGGAPPPGAAALSLRLPGEDGAGEGEVTVAVAPGARATVLGLIRNQSDVVDNFDLSVRGLPDGWWTIAPATAYLVPYGSGGTYEQEVQIHLHPPRTPQAQARPWSFEVVAVSRAFGGEVAAAAATRHDRRLHRARHRAAPRAGVGPAEGALRPDGPQQGQCPHRGRPGGRGHRRRMRLPLRRAAHRAGARQRHGVPVHGVPAQAEVDRAPDRPSVPAHRHARWEPRARCRRAWPPTARRRGCRGGCRSSRRSWSRWRW